MGREKTVTIDLQEGCGAAALPEGAVSVAVLAGPVIISGQNFSVQVATGIRHDLINIIKGRVVSEDGVARESEIPIFPSGGLTVRPVHGGSAVVDVVVVEVNDTVRGLLDENDVLEEVV